MPADKPTGVSRIKLKSNSTACPYDQRAFRPLDPTVSRLSHLALAIYMFVFNFDALAQASDTRIERWQVIFINHYSTCTHTTSKPILSFIGTYNQPNNMHIPTTEYCHGNSKWVICGMRYLSEWDDMVSGWRLHRLLSINGIIPTKRCLVSVLRTASWGLTHNGIMLPYRGFIPSRPHTVI